MRKFGGERGLSGPKFLAQARRPLAGRFDSLSTSSSIRYHRHRISHSRRLDRRIRCTREDQHRTCPNFVALGARLASGRSALPHRFARYPCRWQQGCSDSPISCPKCLPAHHIALERSENRKIRRVAPMARLRWTQSLREIGPPFLWSSSSGLLEEPQPRNGSSCHAF